MLFSSQSHLHDLSDVKWNLISLLVIFKPTLRGRKGFHSRSGKCSILFPVEANSIFVEIPRDMADSLPAKGHYFYSWPLLGRNIYRLVTSFNTLPEDIDRFIDSCT
jgi:hypothetical protein